MSSTPASEVRSPRYGGYKSPNVRTRFQEKEELSDLNDRLATYIRRMQNLEQQNNKLTAEITTSKASVSREVGNVRALFESELADARRMIDELSKEKAALTLENDKLNGIIDDLRAKLEKETTGRARAEQDLKHTERRLHEKEGLYLTVSKERKMLDDRCKELEAQLQDSLDELDKEKGKLEDEMLRRVDVENKYQTLLEEKKFMEEVHRKEVSDLKQISDTFKFEVDGPLPDHDDILREKLEDLRDIFEEEAENAKQELVDAYGSKNEALQVELERSNTARLRLIEKYDSLKTELDKLKSDYALIEAKNKQLQKQVAELEDLRLLDKDEFSRQLQDYSEKNKDLQDEIKRLREDYQDLLSIKVALDLEINAYRKLLEGEEERLHISPGGDQRSQTTGSRRGTKRRRPMEQEVLVQQSVNASAVGNLEIVECDADGKFVKLRNKSETEDEALGGWFIQRVVNGRDDEAIEYKFTPKFVLKAGQTVTIWSASAGVKQKTPSDLVLKNNENWPTGQSVVTSAINPEAEIMAKHTIVPSFSEETGSRKSRKRRTGQDKESCNIM